MQELRVAAMGGNIRRVIQMLSSSSEEVQRLAAAILARQGDRDDNRIGLVRAGAIPPLVHLLGSGSATVQQNAATALGKLHTRHNRQVTQLSWKHGSILCCLAGQ